MSLRPQIVVANKCDMPDTEDQIKRLQEQVTKDYNAYKNTEKEGLLDPKVYAISAVTGQGVRELNLTIASKVAEIKAKRKAEQTDTENYDKV